MKAQYNPQNFSFTIDGADVDALVLRGAADAIVKDAQANIGLLAERLRSGQINLGEWSIAMKGEVKWLHMASYALAHGGFAQVSDWTPCEEIIAAQFGNSTDYPGLYAFAKDIQAGRYGAAGELNEAFLNRAISYGSAGRATFENEQLRVRIEAGHIEARRIRSASDSCESCVAWAALGWIPAREMYENYAIGSGKCNVNCNCVIVTRKEASK